MPKQKGFIKIHGTLNGTSYYPLLGEYISRKATGPSKERIQTDPAFINVKHNNQEFGGASTLSKGIRQGLTGITTSFKDTRISSRLTSVCYKIIKKGSGSLGYRNPNILRHPEALIGFQLNETQVFNQIYTAKPIVTSHNNRRNITITIPKSTENHLKRLPKNATHMQLSAALSMVSNYQWHVVYNNYLPVRPEFKGLGTSVKTQPVLCKTDHTNLQIQLETPVKTHIPTNIAITVWLGIQFLELQNTQFKPLISVKAMQCIAVL